MLFSLIYLCSDFGQLESVCYSEVFTAWLGVRFYVLGRSGLGIICILESSISFRDLNTGVHWERILES